MQLVYAKGEHYYEDAPVNNARWEDLDMDLVEDYVKVIGYGKGAETYLRENGYVVKKEDYRGREYEALTGAAVLLFGKNPQRFFQRAQVRVIRYDGTEARVGTEMNVVKDEIFTGPILKLTNDVLAFVKTQIKEHTYLGPDGRFRTDEQYPEFCWTELCVNAICHRDYSILGTDLQVKLFDDHITVESPGILPGLVRPYNIREMHFSRNPKIALYMRSYKLVKEFGEGVDRMFREMEEEGLPAPEYRQNEFLVFATIRQAKVAAGQVAGNGGLNGDVNGLVNGDDRVNDSRNDSLSDSVNSTYQAIKANPGIQRKRISELTGKSIPTIDRHIALLAKSNLIEHRDSDKKGGYYVKK